MFPVAAQRLLAYYFETSKLGVVLTILTIFIIGPQVASPQIMPSSLLDLRVEQPLRWADGCEADLGARYKGHSDSIDRSALLKLGVDVTNRSTEAMYLPVKYLHVDLQVIRAQTLALQGEEYVWLPLYGVVGDIVTPDWNAEALAPGETRHHDICFYNSFSVTDLRIPEGRRIPLRGKLQISAKYFANRESWEQYRNATAREGAIGTSDGALGPRAVNFEADVPCFGAGCRAGCNTPPLIFTGETVSNTDISAKSENGLAINEELARRFPACVEDGARP